MNEKTTPESLQSFKSEASEQWLKDQLSGLESSLRQDLQNTNSSIDEKAIKLSQEIGKVGVEVSELRRDLSGQVFQQSENSDKLSQEIREVRECVSSLHRDLSEVLVLIKERERVVFGTGSVQRTKTNQQDSETSFSGSVNGSKKSEGEENSAVFTKLQSEERFTQENAVQSLFQEDLLDPKSTCSPNDEMVIARSSDDVRAEEGIGINTNYVEPTRGFERSLESRVVDSKPHNDKDSESLPSKSQPLPPVSTKCPAMNRNNEHSLQTCVSDTTVCVNSTPCCVGHHGPSCTNCSNCFTNVCSNQSSPAVNSACSLSSAPTTNAAMRVCSTTSTTQPFSSVLTHSNLYPTAFATSGDTNVATEPGISNSNNAKVEPPCTGTTIVPISLLPTEEVHRYRNSVLVQKLMPEALQTLLGWLSQDRPSEKSFLWYIKYVTNLSTTKLKEKYYISALEMQVLGGNDLSVFDATLLVKLIKLLAKISDCGHMDADHDDTSAACLLWKLKNYRNLVSHKIKTSSTNADIFTAAKKCLLSLFSVVDTTNFSVKKEVFENVVSELRRAFDNIASTDYERQCMERQCVFRTQSFEESQTYWRTYCTTESIPFTTNVASSEQIFHPMEIFEKEDVSTNRAILLKESYKHILKRACEDERKATILVGEAGSGKTTVVKNIASQFLGIIDSEVEFLREIHLLLFVECRDRFTNTLERAMSNNFPKACQKISTEKAIECFCFLGNLIIIDGYDEVNESSSEVINQVLRLMKRMSACQLLFTTRPHRAGQLKELLNFNGIPFTVFELVPLYEEQDQLQFLQRYEMNVSHANDISNGMVETFKALLPEVKEFFIYPINLVLFYFLYCNSRDNISNWETSNDVIEQMLVLYEKFIARKLLERHLINIDRFIREALEEVYQFALHCISENKIMLSCEDMRPVHECLDNKFQEWQLLSKLDTTVVTSIVFLTKTVPNPNCPVVYQFYHKGIMEIMAARTFVKLMKKESYLKLEQLLDHRTDQTRQRSGRSKSTKPEFSRYQNVLLFVLSYLSQPSNLAILVSRMEELRQLFASLDVNMKYCSEMLLCKPQSAPLMELCVSLVKSIDYIEIKTQREFRAMTIVLAHFHPETIRVCYNTKEELPNCVRELLLVLKDTFLGKLDLILGGCYSAFIPVDSLVTDVMPARFTLNRFCGCLASEQGMKSLALQLNLSDDPRHVTISVPKCYGHNLEILQNCASGSVIKLRYEDPPSEQPPPSTLPPRPLRVSITDTGKGKHIRDLILALAPKDRRFYSIILENCSIDKTDLQQMVLDLRRARVSTISAMSTDVVKLEFRFGSCEACDKREHQYGHHCVELNIKEF
ncbi:P-loop containing nucleoside triphosphate hydrolase [Trinorchestia longiramus]|nr:P-loop containing nucleoside triphosphate hydrolase [Trinorchestia longiramus]